MKMIVGLGNPGPEYTYTRHNLGFQVVTAYAAALGTGYKMKEKFQTCLAETTLHQQKVLLVKPMTFYNNTGSTVQALSHFYKIPPDNVLIVHDELALPFGTIRTRIGGSDAGNNGVRSISAHIGTDTSRVRIGIGQEVRHSQDDASFVLSRLDAEQQRHFEEAVLPDACRLIDAFIAGGFSASTSRTS